MTEQEYQEKLLGVLERLSDLAEIHPRHRMWLETEIRDLKLQLRRNREHQDR